MPTWSTADLSVSLVDDLSGGPVATLAIGTPFVMGEPRIEGRLLHAGAIHVHGSGIAPNEIGPVALRCLLKVIDRLPETVGEALEDTSPTV